MLNWQKYLIAPVAIFALGKSQQTDDREIAGEYQYTNNSSTDPAYSYTRNLALLSLARFF